MDHDERERYLRWALQGFGMFLLVGVYPLMNGFWPEGRAREPRQSGYEQMIAGIYAVLGVFLMIASRARAADE